MRRQRPSAITEHYGLEGWIARHRRIFSGLTTIIFLLQTIIPAQAALASPTVNLRNGNLVLPFSDISLPGSGFNLELQRTYNSRSTQKSAFGFGWSFSLGSRLILQDRDITILNPDGSTTRYTQEDKDLYRSEFGETIKKARAGYTARRKSGIHEYFDDQGRLITRSDRNGNMLSLHYQGKALQYATMGDGRTLKFLHDNKGQITTMTGPMGRQWQYQYDHAGNLQSVITPGKRKSVFDYDKLHNLRRITYPDGTRTQISYNKKRDWVSSEKGPGTKKTSYKFTPVRGNKSRHQTIVTDAMGHITRYNYAGDKLTITNATGATTSLKLCSEGCSNVKEVTNANGHTWHYRYDNTGNLIETQNPEGGKGIVSYDQWGLLVSRTSPAGHTTRVERDTKGNPLKAVDATGRIFQMAYDSKGNRIVLRPPGSSKIQYLYDPMGNIVQANDSTGWKKTLKRDKAGRIIQAINASGSMDQYRYDHDNHLLSHVDALGRKMAFKWSATGKLTALSKPGGITETIKYDSAGRLTAHSDAVGRTTSYRYDHAGNLIERINPDGQRIKYSYNSINLLTLISSEKDKVIIKYNRLGQIVEASNAHARYRYSYDALGRITELQLPRLGHRINYSYDADGLRTSVAFDAEKPTLFSYDPQGRIKHVQLPSLPGMKFNYDNSGRLIHKHFPNGLDTYYRYDKAGHLSRIRTQNKRGKLLSAIQYQSDRIGQKTRRNETGTAPATYRYDKAGQLLKVSSKSESVKYIYDERGNRMQTIGAQRTLVYHYDNADQLLQAGNEYFKYDANGNLIKRQTGSKITRYSYDFANRLTTASLPDGNSVHYFYGPFGNRVKTEHASGKVTHYIYDGLNLYAALDEQMNVLARYHAYALDNIASVERAGQHHFYHTDHLGSVQMVSNMRGTITQKYTYHAFGSIKSSSGQVQNQLLFTSRPYDEETGLYDFRNRTYDPKLGRFLQRDPIPDINPYVYVHNNPVNRLDPLGLSDVGDPWTWAGLGLAGLGGVILGVATAPAWITAGYVCVVVGGGVIAIKGIAGIWGTAENVADKADITGADRWGMTDEDREWAGLPPLKKPQDITSPDDCPDPEPNNPKN